MLLQRRVCFCIVQNICSNLLVELFAFILEAHKLEVNQVVNLIKNGKRGRVLIKIWIDIFHDVAEVATEV